MSKKTFVASNLPVTDGTTVPVFVVVSGLSDFGKEDLAIYHLSQFFNQWYDEEISISVICDDDKEIGGENVNKC